MVNLKVNEEIIRKWCEEHLDTHTDWTGTRVETKYECSSVDDFIKMLMMHIEDNQQNTIAKNPDDDIEEHWKSFEKKWIARLNDEEKL